MTLDHHHRARNPRAIALLVLLWLGLVGLWRSLDAAPLLVLLFMAALIPAGWDIARDRRASFHLDAKGLSWTSGAQSAAVPRDRIEEFRIDTRLDRSLRVTLRLTDGTRLRIPPDALPPATRLLPALEALGYSYERRPFAFL